MVDDMTVFEKTYADYLIQIAQKDFSDAGPILGVTVCEQGVSIPFLGDIYIVTPDGIANAAGHHPPFEISVLLSKYLLLCPDKPPEGNDWVHYRDFKDSGPLIVYFDQDVERPLARFLSEYGDQMSRVTLSLNGIVPEIDAAYDYACQFDTLPKIPLLMLFNAADATFPATCSLLYEKRAEQFLDAESLAILGRLVVVSLERHLSCEDER